MICYPSVDQATPLLVVGPQRSGTRFVTNVLNSLPGVTIQDEIPAGVMESLKWLTIKCENKYANSEIKARADSWECTKHDFMFAAWGNLTQGRRRESDTSCIYYGYKTPFHEKYFDFYNAFFDPVRPKYVCCIRSFIDHYFSVSARWPERTIHLISRRYINSLRQISYMKKQRPDAVLLFFLDDYKEIGMPYPHQRIFMPLGLEKVDRAEKKAMKGPANASEQMGFQKRSNLTWRQELYLKLSPEPMRLYDGLKRDFG